MNTELDFTMHGGPTPIIYRRGHAYWFAGLHLLDLIACVHGRWESDSLVETFICATHVN